MVLYKFLSSQTGAVTVDWVVLTAAVVGIGIPAVGFVASGTSALGSDVDNSLSNASVHLAFPTYVTDTFPAYSMHSWNTSEASALANAQGYQDLIDRNIANSTDEELVDLYDVYTSESAGSAFTAAALRQMLSETGSYDFETLNRIITENGHEPHFSENFMDQRLARVGGDVAETAVLLDLYRPVMDSFSYAYGEELRRRGVYPEG